MLVDGEQDAGDLIKKIGALISNDKTKEHFLTWGESTENKMYDQFVAEHTGLGFDSAMDAQCDLTLMTSAVVFQQTGEDAWMTGYKFIIEHAYSRQGVEVKRYIDWCFLAFGGSKGDDCELGKDVFIVEFFEKTDIEKEEAVISLN